MPRTIEPNTRHEELLKALQNTLRNFPDLSPPEWLAVASQFVGQLIAFQDQTKYTPESIMRMVGTNIETGNATAIDVVLNMPQGNA